ncbi:MAG TPA: hypothetical protein VND87_14045 [Stellaceae bacterium]|nr:hypothetical protein [Stellaceae bacterium]
MTLVVMAAARFRNKILVAAIRGVGLRMPAAGLNTMPAHHRVAGAARHG